MGWEEQRYVGYLRQDIPRPIIVNAQNVLQFYLEVRSPRGPNVPQYVTCFADLLEEHGFYDDAELDQDRKESLYYWLMHRVLTFRVELRGQHAHAAELAVYEQDLNFHDIGEYEPVPVLKEVMAVGVPIHEAIVQGITLRNYNPPETTPGQPVIAYLWNHFFGPLQRLHGGLRAEKGQMGWAPAIVDNYDVIDDGDCLFLRKEKYQALIRDFRAGVRVPEQLPRPAHAAPSIAAPPPAVVPEVKPSPWWEQAESTPADGDNLTEESFLARFKQIAAGEGLFFRPEELIHFHTALKTGSLVVLAGLSGTGKSRLVEVYRRTLGLPERTHFLWLSVRPNWDDDADLIGYYDPMGQLYRPGETGLVDLLVRAQSNPEELFLVCFDEMNLARVEHYFSQFLSSLERPEEQRYLHLYSPELVGAVSNADRYPPQVRLGPNVLFCGTINVDETTHAFSDKVLDRANVIRMDHVDIRLWYQQLRAVHTAAAATQEAPGQSMVSHQVWRAWSRPFDPAPYVSQVDFLHELNELLGQVGHDKKFGYRVVRQILLYLHFTPATASGRRMVTVQDALDAQVCQRILTKVRGTGADLLELFAPDGPLESLLKKHRGASFFTASLAEIRRKYQELERHDFTA